MNIKIKKKQKYHTLLPFPQYVLGHTISRVEGYLIEIDLCSQMSHKRNIQNIEIELAPFPGFQKLTLEESYLQLMRDLKEVPLSEIFTCEDFSKQVNRLQSYSLGPSSFFSLLQICDQLQEKPHHQHPPLSNKLLTFEQFQTLNPEQEFKFSKYKVKIAKQDIQEIISVTHNHRSQLEKKSLRLDMNARWPAEKLNELWDELIKMNLANLIDYFEEPLHHYNEYLKLKKDIPIMHEEFAQYFGESPSHALGIVYKPSQVPLFGNINKDRIVLSSCWEGPHGVEALKRLASLFPQETHGLGATIKYENIGPAQSKIRT